MILDHNEARIWADHHHGFARWLTDCIARATPAFRTLVRLQYRAPWEEERTPDRAG